MNWFQSASRVYYIVGKQEEKVWRPDRHFLILLGLWQQKVEHHWLKGFCASIIYEFPLSFLPDVSAVHVIFLLHVLILFFFPFN